MTRVATVILNWNRFEDTSECVRSVLQAAHDGWEHHVVVVDNGSTDGSADRLAERFPEASIVRLSENFGFAGGMNRGIEWVSREGFDHVILLNNDTLVAPDALAHLVEEVKRGEAGAVMPLICDCDTGAVTLAGARLRRPWQRVEPIGAPRMAEPHTVGLVTGCCVLIPLAVIEQVGAFDERYFLYFEDIDLALRISAAGHALRVIPAAAVYHKESRSSGGPASPGVMYYLVRNNLLLNREWGGALGARGLGYLYLAALSVKMALNPLLERRAGAGAAARSIAQGWRDFARGRWGARR